jgi:seryl-tRNA synthetase
MLEPGYFQEKVAELEAALKKRNAGNDVISTISDLSKRRKELIHSTEALKAKRNSASQEIAQLKAKSKTDPAAAAEADKKVLEMRAVGDQIKALDEELRGVEEKFGDLALRVPNIPHASVPAGKDEKDNQEVRKWGTPTKLAFEAKDHTTIGERLGILDFERATRIRGSHPSFHGQPRGNDGNRATP